jgi:N,N'-diacetyllegionaminate synthase
LPSVWPALARPTRRKEREMWKRDGTTVIAEIGANHDGDKVKAHRMIDAVADAGASLVKFQLYTAAELVSDRDRVVRWGPPGREREETVGGMFDRLSVSREAMAELFTHARERGLVPFASPFSERGIDDLVALGAPLLKIAASDVNHLPMLAHAARTGLPVVLSLGKCTLAEADEAVRCLEENGCSELALLHCVASYPSPMEEMNLRVIPMLRAAYPECTIGFSDHSLGLTAAIAAAAIGARIIEKHVTLRREDEGPDHWFSLEMHELEALIRAVGGVDVAMGSSRKIVTGSEAVGRARATRSIVASRDLPAGTVLCAEDFAYVRPGGGIAPGHAQHLVGMKLSMPLRAMEQLAWSHVRSTPSEWG